MNIQILDSWLREYLKTKASPYEIGKYLSLCGPSFEKITKRKKDYLYEIEVTTNRVDSASVYGIAREASVILPRFGIEAKLIPIKTCYKGLFSKKVSYLEARVDPKLCKRFTAVLIRNVKIQSSPAWLAERLENIGYRPINNVVDVSNYLSRELGQPMHTFDYDKISGHLMILRQSRKNEKLTTLDGQEVILGGGDIVIEDGSEKLIDLAGIMGGKNSEVDKNTKNVLLFVQTYDAVAIRKTAMSLAKWTDAARLFEKGLDPELVKVALQKAVDFLQELTQGKADKQVLDLYFKPFKANKVEVEYNHIQKILGISLAKAEIVSIMRGLGYKANWSGDTLVVEPPSFRASDTKIGEDVIEEIARIYGYHKIPSALMCGALPEKQADSPFDFEIKLKRILKALGATETYTLSLVSKSEVSQNAYQLKNPLGNDTNFLRTSLLPSLTKAANENKGNKEAYHLFEMANIYLKAGHNKLPQEKMLVAGIFCGWDFREAKGVIESLLEELHLSYRFKLEDTKNFKPSQRIIFSCKNNEIIGQFGVLEKSYIYYEFDVEKLRKYSAPFAKYQPLPKYPPQIEDLTVLLPKRTKIGDVISSIQKTDIHIYKVELTTIYKDSYTFRIYYQDPQKTLSNHEVEVVRKKVIKTLKQKFGGVIK